MMIKTLSIVVSGSCLRVGPDQLSFPNDVMPCGILCCYLSISLCRFVLSMYFSRLVVVLLAHLADVDDNVETLFLIEFVVDDVDSIF